MPASLSANTLLPIYLLLLGIGVLASLGLTLLGEAGESPPPAPLGPPTLVACVTCFGGAGILALRLFRFSPGLSLLAAALFAPLSAALFFSLAWVARRAAERRQALADLVGALARVTTPIGPGTHGTITTNGSRPPLMLSATSRNGLALPAGTTVVVIALRGEAAEVAPLPQYERRTADGQRAIEQGS